MGSNSFGTLFRITTWGESHGKAIGVVIDGCPSGLELKEEEINQELFFRKPGSNPYVTQRKEEDRAEILSGVFEGKTTGAPLSIIIYNKDVDSSKYEPIKDLLRPGHANFTYLHKYGIFDYRGGGRASARETACRVAAGAVAKKLLAHFNIELLAYIDEIGGISGIQEESFVSFKKKVKESSLFCPDPLVEKRIQERLQTVKEEGDSLGGIVKLISTPLPIGLGDPIYEKLEAKLASAMLSIPASKGVEWGDGFLAAKEKGSCHNDLFSIDEKNEVQLISNHAGGILGGISTGMPLVMRVVFKPTSSIAKDQKTVTLDHKKETLVLPKGSRHDPCVAIRAVPVVEAMAALVMVDALLLNRCSKLEG